MMFFWGQAIGFQALWFNAVLGKNPWLLLGVALLITSVVFSPKRRDDLNLWPLALIGLAGDAVLTATGVFNFDHTPFWLASIWLGFVFTLNHSLHWLQNINVLAQAAIGAVAGTLSYLAGARLGAVELPYGLLASVVVLSAYWSLLLPAMVFMRRRLVAAGG